jgi:enoyl-CoA hydratase/carnithine racemase
MNEDEVLYEVRDGIAWLTINRPDARNALNAAVRTGLAGGFTRFAADDGAAVLVLTGAGEKAFCAGGDLKEMSAGALTVPPRDFVPYLQRTIDVDKPVIAAVNGVAFAGGFLLSQMVDLCVAADHATFAITEAKVGRGAPWAAPLPWLVGPRIALELLLTAEPITAQRAYEVGLVNRVVAAADLQATTQELALTIARNAPLSVRAGKRLVYASASLGWHEGLEQGDRIFREVYLSDDAQEGPRAFKERRAPVWSGR